VAGTGRVSIAQYPPPLNPHLTKNRLNDAPPLCEMLFGIDRGSSGAVRLSMRRDNRRNDRSLERERVGPVWMQGG
jgi:hypothetical protein